MTISADRATGAFFLLFGLGMYFSIIPASVEAVDDGNIHPDTLPNFVSLVIAACGALLLVKPTTHKLQSPRHIMIAGVYAGVLAAAITAMSWVGFLPVAPFLALIIMVLIGERRPTWLAAGMFAVPAVIWVFVVQILDRALP